MGDLVIITGAGQHSAPEEGAKLRATVERLLAALHLPACPHGGPGLRAAPAPAAAEADALSHAAGSMREQSSIDGGIGAGSRRRQQLVAFKFLGARKPYLSAHPKADDQDAERHAVSTPARAAVEPTAANLEAAGAGSSGDDGEGQPPAGPWSRSEAARLLTEAILLDWTTPWQAGIVRGADRWAGGRRSWAAAGGVRSRVAETTARLGTDWLSAAAGKGGDQSVDPHAVAGRAAEALGGAADAERRASSEQVPAGVNVPNPAVAETMSARNETQHNVQNAGRLVILHDALVAWLESKSVRTASHIK